MEDNKMKKVLIGIGGGILAVGAGVAAVLLNKNRNQGTDEAEVVEEVIEDGKKNKK